MLKYDWWYGFEGAGSLFLDQRRRKVLLDSESDSHSAGSRREASRKLDTLCLGSGQIGRIWMILVSEPGYLQTSTGVQPTHLDLHHDQQQQLIPHGHNEHIVTFTMKARLQVLSIRPSSLQSHILINWTIMFGPRIGTVEPNHFPAYPSMFSQNE